MDLIERDAALRQLQDRLRIAGSGGHVALVAGEAGIGKTSLLRALAAACADAVLWWGGCDALQTPHPLAPLHDIARSAEPGFGELLAAPGDRVALFEAVLAALARSPRPVLFVIEDAHWADAATLDLLKFLGRRIERVPCLLAISFRDDEVGATHPLRRLTGELPADAAMRIDLPRLTPAGVEALARRALRSASGIHAATQGNPFFVTELLRHGSERVPHGVQDLVLARFAKLSREAQEIVRLASVVPARIESRLIDELLSPSPASLEECLDSGLLQANSNGLAFRHELARVAVESSLSAPVAQALHAHTLAALESAGTDAVPLARLVHHATRAGDSAAVLRLAPSAAEQARQRGAHKEAAAHLRAALAHGATLADAERAELLDRLSYECYLTDRIAEAISARESACELWRTAGNALKEGDALRWLSRLSWYNGQRADAVRYAGDAIATLQAPAPSHELAMAYSNLSQLHMLAGESALAIEWGGKALALADALGDREVESHALNNVGAAKFQTFDDSGRLDLERSLGIALAEGFEEHAARAFTNLSYDTLATHDFARAEDYLERGIAYCEKHDLDSWVRYMASCRSELWLAQGDWQRAADLAGTVIRSPDVAPISKIIALVVQGRVHARRGEADAAMERLDEALQLAMPTGEFQRMGPVASARAEAAWLRGDPGAVVEETRTAWDSARQKRYWPWMVSELAWWRHRADALDALPQSCVEPYALQIAGDWRAAAAAWAALDCPYERARALAEGDAPARIEALALFEKLGAQPDAERLRRQLHAAGVRGVPRGQRASTQANPHGLTAREAEILGLLCEGLRNAEIAGRLHRSVRTIDHHLASVFVKLGVESRTEAVAAARRLGLPAGE